jgi:hypothetical protein
VAKARVDPRWKFRGEEGSRMSSATSDILQGINSLIILGAWTVWTHRNRCVFNGAAPDIARTLIVAKEERKLWSLARAWGISLLTAPIQKVKILVLLLVALRNRHVHAYILRIREFGGVLCELAWVGVSVWACLLASLGVLYVFFSFVHFLI